MGDIECLSHSLPSSPSSSPPLPSPPTPPLTPIAPSILENGGPEQFLSKPNHSDGHLTSVIFLIFPASHPCILLNTGPLTNFSVSIESQHLYSSPRLTPSSPLTLDSLKIRFITEL